MDSNQCLKKVRILQLISALVSNTCQVKLGL